MKILIIGTRYAPIPNVEGGAIETLITEYLGYVSKKKDLYVVYSAYSDRINSSKLKIFDNVEFRYINTKSIMFKIMSFVVGALRRLLNNPMIANYYAKLVVKDLEKRRELDKYDAVIIENELSSIPYVKSKLSGKIISHIHNDYYNTSTPNINAIADACDEVWCVSKFILNRVKEIIKDKSKVKLLYNGINLNSFNTNIDLKKQNNIKAKYNINKNDFVFLYTGRIMEAKGVLELVKAFNIISKGKDNIKLLIVGGRLNNKKGKKYLKKVQKEAKDNKNIIFTGYVDYDKISVFYSIASVQVIPSLCEEAFGLIAVEGLIFGLPIIATNSGGLPEIIDSQKGILIENDNIVTNLVTSMEYYLNNKKKIIKNKTNVDFSIEKYNNTFYNLLHR